MTGESKWVNDLPTEHLAPSVYFRFYGISFTLVHHLTVLKLINLRCLYVKVKSSLCLTKQHALRSTLSFTSTLDGGEWSVSHPGRFTPRVRAPVTYWIGGWVGPRPGLDAVSKRKEITASPGSEPRSSDRPDRKPSRYTDWAIPALNSVCAHNVSNDDRSLPYRHICISIANTFLFFLIQVSLRCKCGHCHHFIIVQLHI
jgi:hypothetical protein